MNIEETKAAQANTKGAMLQIISRAESANRDLNAEERVEYDALAAKFAQYDVELEKPASRPVTMQLENLDDGTRISATEGPRVFSKGESLANPPRRESEQMHLGHIMRAMVHRNGAAPEVLNSLTIGTDSEGGYLVPDELSREFIDNMRAASVVSQAGAMVVPMINGTVAVPRVLTDPTFAWTAEEAAYTETTPTFDQVTLTAQKCAAIVKVSEELLMDGIDIEARLVQLLNTAAAQELDRVTLYGSGSSNQPEGLINKSGINEVSMGTNGGQIADYDPLTNALYELRTDNAPYPTAAILAPRSQLAIDQLVDTTGQPLQRPPALADLPLLVTSKAPIDETQGTSNDASSILVGDFPQIWIGIRSGFRVQRLNELFAGTGQIGFRLFFRMDVAVTREDAFCRVKGIIE